MDKRELAESPTSQGPTEEIAYTVTVPSTRAALSNLVFTLYDITDGDNPVDVTNAQSTGAPSAASNVYTTPKLISLTSGNTYRADCQYDSADGNTYCPYFRVVCK